MKYKRFPMNAICMVSTVMWEKKPLKVTWNFLVLHPLNWLQRQEVRASAYKLPICRFYNIQCRSLYRPIRVLPSALPTFTTPPLNFLFISIIGFKYVLEIAFFSLISQINKN